MTASDTSPDADTSLSMLSPRGLAKRFFGPPADPLRTSPFFRLSRAFCSVLSTNMFSLRVTGTENIPRKGGVLLVSNHQSYLDPVLIGVRVQRPVSFMARSTLFNNPAFDALISTLYAFPVKRGEGDIGAMRQAISLLKQGHILNVFPEGTRSATGEIQPIASGIGLIIRRAGCPVIPVYINGSFRAWPRTRKLPQPTPIEVIFGKTYDLSQLKGADLSNWIDNQFRQLRDQVRAKFPPT